MRYSIPATVLAPEMTETIDGSFIDFDELVARSIVDRVKKFDLFMGVSDLGIAELQVERLCPSPSDSPAGVLPRGPFTPPTPKPGCSSGRKRT